MRERASALAWMSRWIARGFTLGAGRTTEPPGTSTVAVTPSYLAYVVEQLGRIVSEVRSRRMFGEVGLYSSETFFALLADDVLYFKVDDASRPDFEARGMPPFRPYGEGGAAMQYYQLPEEVFEDPEVLRSWAERAIGIARRKKRRPARRGRDVT